MLEEGGGRRINHKPQQGERVYTIVPCFPKSPQTNIAVESLYFHFILFWLSEGEYLHPSLVKVHVHSEYVPYGCCFLQLLPECRALFTHKSLFRIRGLCSLVLIQMQSDIISFISYHWNITIANNFSFIPNIDYFKAQSEIANIGVITLKSTHIIRAMS